MTYAPVAVYGSYPGAMQAGLVQGKAGIGVGTHGGASALGGDTLTLSASFPLEPKAENLRSAGWVVGMLAGSNPTDPGFYFWELMIGRGTTSAVIEEHTGLRGYWEFALRNVRPSQPDLLIGRRDLLGLVIRTGASNSFDAEGLVDQRAPQYVSSAFDISFLIPFNDQRAITTFGTRLFAKCGWDHVLCGLAGQYMYSPGSEKLDIVGTENFVHIVSAGPALRLPKIFPRISIDSRLMWSWVRNHSSWDEHALPTADLNFFASF